MPPIHTTIVLPENLWHAVQLLAKEEGDANTVILRALEEYVTDTRRRRGHQRSGKYRTLVQALSTPVTALHLSARPAAALHLMNIRHVCELVTLEPRDLRMRQNFGAKSLREVKEKLAALGLALGMPVEGDAYRAAVVATVAASIRAAKS